MSSSSSTLLDSTSTTTTTTTTTPHAKRARNDETERRELNGDVKHDQVEGDSERYARLNSCFDALESKLRAFDEKREVVIKKSRDVQKFAKQAIYALQRHATMDEGLQRALDLMAQCERLANAEILPLVREDPELRQGSFANALEEYAEAAFFHRYVIQPSSSSSSSSLPRSFVAAAAIASSDTTTATPPVPHILTLEEMKIALTPDEYLGGLCDTCGEVQRQAVFCATKGDSAGVRRAREYVDFVMGKIMVFDLRNGNLRKKTDALKWSLKRIEDVLFDLTVRGRVPVAEAGSAGIGEIPGEGGGEGA